LLASDAVPVVHSLPWWFQITSAALSVVGAGIGVYLFILKLMETYEPAKLDVNLTKDSFLRLNFLGESIFCVATVLARRAPILIRSATLTLRKTDGAQKRFDLQVRHFGEILHGPNLFADHKFLGSSVLMHVPENEPRRVVYLCHLKDYIRAQSALIQEFNQSVLAKKDELIRRQLDAPEDEEPANINRDVMSEIQALCERFLDRMMAAVQLENGHYELSLTITFESLGSRARVKKRRQSEISILDFALPDDVRDSLRGALLEALRTEAANVILEKETTHSWPLVSFSEGAEL
jgi:hypothetical protein